MTTLPTDRTESGGRILIVDDSLLDLHLLAHICRGAGYTVHESRGGTEALDLAAKLAPDLILLDIVMPEMDGYAVCAQFRRQSGTRSTPIIFISGLSDAIDTVRAFDVGGADYVQKPFRKAEVLARIRHHLALHNLQRELERANTELEQRVRERTAELERLNQELRAEQERIVTAQEEVRHHLARELHDNTAQMLSLIIMNLDLTRQKLSKGHPEEIGRELEEIGQVARQANREVRTLLFELRPTVLEGRGLIPALEAYHQQLVSTMDAEVELDIQPLDFALHSQGARAVFGVIQEAINNVRRHARAQHVWIRIGRQMDQLVFEVEDDGVGFDVDGIFSRYQKSGSYGLFNMRDRATMFGGSLNLRSPGLNGRGTLVRSVMPVTRLRQAE